MRLRYDEAGEEADREVDGGEYEHESRDAGEEGRLCEVAALRVDRHVRRVNDGSLDLHWTIWGMLQYSDLWQQNMKRTPD